MPKYQVKCHTTLVVEAKDKNDAVNVFLSEAGKGGFAFTYDLVELPSHQLTPLQPELPYTQDDMQQWD